MPSHRPAPPRSQTYRGHRLQIQRGDEGWTVTILGPAGEAEMLRNRMPNGLSTLLSEARERVDRRLGEGPGALLHI